jgi:hypothetical protein
MEVGSSEEAPDAFSLRRFLVSDPSLIAVKLALARAGTIAFVRHFW